MLRHRLRYMLMLTGTGMAIGSALALKSTSMRAEEAGAGYKCSSNNSECAAGLNTNCWVNCADGFCFCTTQNL